MSNGLASCGFEVLDRPEVSRVLFHPRRDPTNRPVPLRVRSLRIAVAQEVGVSARLHRADPAGPTLLYFHGNGEIASDYDGISPLYTGLGINFLVVDYRGYGSSDGQPVASSLLTDAVRVYEKAGSLLLEHELKPEPLYIMGRSLGSAAAIEIAWRAQDGIAGLILESGFAYTFPLLATLGLRLPMTDIDEARDGFGQLNKIGRVRVPTCIIHGQEDRLIQIENGRALYERSGAADKRLVVIPHAGHNDLLFSGQQPYIEAIRSFVIGGDKAQNGPAR